MFYGNAADFLDYHTSRGRDIPGTWDNDYIESALLVASEWLDAQYANSWIGTPTAGFEQVRQWPRTDATITKAPEYTFPDNAIPERVINATYEAAFRQATNQGSLTVDFSPLKYKSARVEGAVAVEYNLLLNNSTESQIQITTVQNLMSPLLTSGAVNHASFSGEAVRV
jgi:hypothetical protein